jgi:hypothetical protein
MSSLALRLLPQKESGEPDPVSRRQPEQGGVQAGGARQVVAAAVQHQVAHRRYSRIAALGQGWRQ